GTRARHHRACARRALHERYHPRGDGRREARRRGVGSALSRRGAHSRAGARAEGEPFKPLSTGDSHARGLSFRMHPMPRRFWSLVAAVLITCASPLRRAEQGGAPVAIATYEAASLYWKNNDAGACQVHYRPAGESEWREALAPVYDAKDAEYRGSLV